MRNLTRSASADRAKSYFVIIRGPLGVGKSAVAKGLAKALGGFYISVDSVLEKKGLDNSERKCIPLRNFVKASEHILPYARKKLRAKKIVVLDGNFYHRGQILHLIRNLRAPHFVFTLKAPLKVCMQRDSRRKRIYGRDAVRAVYRLVSRFDYGISINTKNKTARQVIKEIIAFLALIP